MTRLIRAAEDRDLARLERHWTQVVVHWVVTTVSQYFRGGTLSSVAINTTTAMPETAAAAAVAEGEAREFMEKEETKTDSSWLQSPFSEVSEHKSNSDERDEGSDHHTSTSPRVSPHPSSHSTSHPSSHPTTPMRGYVNNGDQVHGTSSAHLLHSFPTLDGDDLGRERNASAPPPGPGPGTICHFLLVL